MKNCPFCHLSNACTLGENNRCWCFSVNVPDELLKLVPQDKKGEVCICRACVELYHQDPSAFAKKYPLT